MFNIRWLYSRWCWEYYQSKVPWCVPLKCDHGKYPYSCLVGRCQRLCSKDLPNSHFPSTLFALKTVTSCSTVTNAYIYSHARVDISNHGQKLCYLLIFYCSCRKLVVLFLFIQGLRKAPLLGVVCWKCFICRQAHAYRRNPVCFCLFSSCASCAFGHFCLQGLVFFFVWK